MSVLRPVKPRQTEFKRYSARQSFALLSALGHGFFELGDDAFFMRALSSGVV